MVRHFLTCATAVRYTSWTCIEIIAKTQGADRPPDCKVSHIKDSPGQGRVQGTTGVSVRGSGVSLTITRVLYVKHSNRRPGLCDSPVQHQLTVTLGTCLQRGVRVRAVHHHFVQTSIIQLKHLFKLLQHVLLPVSPTTPHRLLNTKVGSSWFNYSVIQSTSRKAEQLKYN